MNQFFLKTCLHLLTSFPGIALDSFRAFTRTYVGICAKARHWFGLSDKVRRRVLCAQSWSGPSPVQTILGPGQAYQFKCELGLLKNQMEYTPTHIHLASGGWVDWWVGGWVVEQGEVAPREKGSGNGSDMPTQKPTCNLWTAFCWRARNARLKLTKCSSPPGPGQPAPHWMGSKGGGAGLRGADGKRKQESVKKASSTRMPFDCQRANEAEMPFQYSIGHSSDFCFFDNCPPGGLSRVNYSEVTSRTVMDLLIKNLSSSPLMHFCSIRFYGIV